MEVRLERVTTRAMEVTSSGLSKRRKIASDIKLVNQSCVVISPESSLSPATSENSDRVLASKCSSNDSSVFVNDSLKSGDLKTKGFETENSTVINGRFSRETTPTSELCADSGEELESSMSKPSQTSLRRKPPAVKMLSKAEIEEFFSAAEKYEHKRFADKYNYDIAKDVPLEGQYQWFRLKP
ncbi:hypothetical protein F0562_028660 [Nyssa sinensis]|uniref:Cyclin-dependent kinase inhibitor domain-containing protein n=1 Tax=Nyssa sinensis TaxID=561372 RepID=A0A5J5B2W5_9ASTE|nr:hypothetical protein F0562_028660 [Nyssa sinensis]